MIRSQHKAQICFFYASPSKKSDASCWCEEKVDIWKMLNNIHVNLIVGNPVITHLTAEADLQQVSSLDPEHITS